MQSIETFVRRLEATGNMRLAAATLEGMRTCLADLTGSEPEAYEELNDLSYAIRTSLRPFNHVR